ncbi:MAG TPA: bifunctional transaldolase/phosoglucose isomerase [Terriglobia bacterium]|nr:bifunctional transaldolase/phosoglucose isomerase [Terriglobia bacterium]
MTTSVFGSLPAGISATLDRLDAEKFSQRLWEHDATLWKAEPEHQKIIHNALGWMTVAGLMLEHVDDLLGFVEGVRQAGFKHAVVLGMGGSSLCPDVCRATFGTSPGYLQLQILDSTVPARILSVEKALNLAHTLFMVSSKSGGTVEPLSFFKYFFDRVRAVKGDAAAENFVAITDPGTSLEKLAREHNFRHIFPGQPDIGGRYSALSNFGLVPAALEGVDVRGLLQRAKQAARDSGADVGAEENPGVSLGVIMAEAALEGRDKLTLVVSPGVQTIGDWLEQLIAESTGKEGKGVIPVAGEELGDPTVYGNDRLFVRLQLRGEANPAIDLKLRALGQAGHPVVRIELQDKLELGEEFLRWEIATATAGSLLGIDAFDQPNVQESKDNTNRLLGQFKAEGKLPDESPQIATDAVHFYGPSPARGGSAEDYLTEFLGQRKVNEDYVAIMAYLESTTEHDDALKAIRMALRDGLGVATTLGYGPRFLHSTGQLHKGGPNHGLFIQITGEDAEALPIPGEPYSFSVLKRAQALGDLQSLQSKNRRVIRAHLAANDGEGLAALSALVAGAVKRVGNLAASQVAGRK